MKTAIVIGGGIAGCSTAYELAQRSIEVTLLERQPDIALDASGNPMAVLYPRLTGHTTALELLNLHGYMHTLQLLNSLGHAQAGFYATGVIQLILDQTSDHDQEQAQRSKRGISPSHLAETYRDHAIMTFEPAATLSQIAGIYIQQDGFFFKDAGGVHMPTLCQALVTHQPIRVVQDTTVLHIDKEANKAWRVTTASGFEATADIVVIASGQDANQLAPSLHVPISTIRGQLSFATATAQSQQLRTILTGDGFIAPATSLTSPAKDATAKLHAFGASFNLNDDHDAVRDSDHDYNLALLARLSPEMHIQLKDKVVGGRVAWRSHTPDHLPAAGQLLDVNALQAGKYFYNDSAEKLPWQQGLYLNAAHGAKGLSSAPLCASIIADHAVGAASDLPPLLLNAIQPNRFLIRKMGLKLLAQHLAVPLIR